MATIFNESAVSAEAAGKSAGRQRLLTDARVKGTQLLLDRLTLEAGGELPLAVPATSLAWLHMLSGTARLAQDAGANRLTETFLAFLPPGFRGTLTSERGAALLYGEVPNAAQFDANFGANPPKFRVVDWSHEPVLDSQHDARQRIYLVTPKLFGTKAIKGEMIFYPAGTSAANHHHEGAEHFMYVLRGHGTVYANEQPFAVKSGDVIYYPDRERHYLEAAKDADMVFAEFFAPGEFKTIWVDESQVCTWLPSGRDIRGGVPAREIKAHSSAEILSPQDV